MSGAAAVRALPCLLAAACLFASTHAFSAAQHFDPAFGANGIVQSRFGPSADEVRAVAIQPDGKVVAAGRSFNGATYDIALARYDADGSLDAGFGRGGKVIDGTAFSQEALALALQPDGSILVAGFVLDGEGRSHFQLVRFTAQGVRDATFGNNGYVAYRTTTFIQQAAAIALQPDGRIVVAGEAGDLTSRRFVALRFTNAGVADPSFGTGGAVTLPQLASSHEGATSIALQPDGRIVLGGYAEIPRNAFSFTHAQVLARLNADGTLDGSFAPSMRDLDTDHRNVSIALAPDGKILAGGSAGVNVNGAFAVVRYGADGGVDATFGNAGLAVANVEPGQGGWITGLARQPDGAIVAAGASFQPKYYAARFLAGGALDPGFGNAGIFAQPGSPFLPSAFSYSIEAPRCAAAALQADARIILGCVDQRRSLDFALLRLDAAGALDPTFGTGGLATTELGNGNRSSWTAVQLHPDGRALASGHGADVVAGYITVAAYLRDGTPDPAFGTAGFVRTELGAASNSAAVSSLLQPDGKLMVAGTRYTMPMPLQPVSEIALLRYHADGTLDASFGTQGVALRVSNLSPERLALQPDGKVVVLGASAGERRLLRFNADGSFDGAFGAAGSVVLPNTAFFPELAVQADGAIVVAGAQGATSWRVLRFLPDGSPDPAFVGAASCDFAPLVATKVVGVAIQPDGRIVVGGEASSVGATSGAMALCRLLPTGAADVSFGNGGRTPSSLEAFIPYESLAAMALQDDGKILMAGTGNVAFGEPNGMLLARYLANGARDPVFGTNGRIVGSSAGGIGVVKRVATRGSRAVVALTSQRPDPYVLLGYRLNDAQAPIVDFDGNGRDDLVWAHADGRAALWLMDGTALASSAEVIGAATGWIVTHVGDFNGDGKRDIVWQHGDGRAAIYLLDGTRLVHARQILNGAFGWNVAYTADFNGDGMDDLVFRNLDGSVALWTMAGATMTGGTTLLGPGTGWSVVATADFDGDGLADLLWRHLDGRHAIWLMNGLVVKASAQILNAGSWTATHAPDLDGDGKADIVWRRGDGTVAAWLMNGTAMSTGTTLLNAGTGWAVAHTGDFDGDGKADLFFMHSDGRAAIYLMNGLAPHTTTQILNAGGGWSARRLADLNGDGKADIVWENVDGRVAVWLMNGTTMTHGSGILGPGTGWSISGVSQ